ncbi:MAG: tetratricopeptide repeat protein, partial [Thermoguttaceae bacterium]
MNDDSQTTEYSLSLEAKERIDRICGAFEEAWRQGGRPQAETFLADTTGAERAALLIELLLLDLDYRRRGGEEPIAEEYRVRFPEDEDLIATAFQRAEQSDATVPPPVHDEMLGSSIGPYKLLSVLGEGGFGIVYLAEQEEPIRRQVALKILKAGMDTKQVLARFEAERHTLALMDHANIARIFDAGTTENGRSYFVMELVRGERITAYCDSHKLTLKQRLALFLTVCQAVQHAHQKGIIHRDIKPTNILVTVVDDHPVPKIIDFGLAKAMARPLTEQSIFTERGQLLGTPEYMSPEQAGMAIADIDIRSDIYSLGVLLYELLTGALPFDRRMLRQASFEEICQIIREVEPPRPSMRISTLGGDSQDLAKNRQMDPQSLHRQLRQELDWIVMKALEKDRSRRYAAASALAEDIEHYLAHEPVHAGPPGNWYRARKFARRFRVPLSIAAGFVALLVVITILAVRGYYREVKLLSGMETARGQAEHEAEKAKNNFKMARDAVKKYYTQIAGDPRLKAHNLEKLRRDLLESANEYYEKMINQEADDPELQHERVWTFIDRGNIEREIGNWSAAETAYNNALVAASRLTQIDSLEAEYQNDRAAIHNNLAVLYMATGRSNEAEATYREAIADTKILVERHPEAPKYKNALANSYHNLGLLYVDTGRFKKAETAHKEALALRKGLVEKHPEVSHYQDELAASHDSLGIIYQVTGRTKEALEAKKESLAILKNLVERHPDVPEYQSDLAGCYNNLGLVYSTAGKAQEAEAAHKEALALQKILVKKHPDVPEYQKYLADSYYGLGTLHKAAGRAKEAETAYKEEFALWKILAEKHPEVPEYQGRRAANYNNLGDVYQAGGRAEEAEAAYKEAIATGKIVVEKHPEVPAYQNYLANSYYGLGIVYQAKGRSQEAETAYKEALTTWKILVKEHPEKPESQNGVINSNTGLAEVYQARGRAKEAEAAYKEVLAIQKILAEKHPGVPKFLVALAATYYNLACSYAKSFAEENRRVGKDAGQSAASANTLMQKAFECLQQVCDLGLF